jgi:hypothetical protein
MSVQDYKPIDTAPMDGTVVLVLAGSRKPRAAYWDYKDTSWKFWHAPKEDCYPSYWTAIPADPPSDYLPQLKTLEDEESYEREVNHGVLMDKLIEEGKDSPVEAPKKKPEPAKETPKAAPAKVAAKK